MSNVIHFPAATQGRPVFAIIEQDSRDVVKLQAFGPAALVYSLLPVALEMSATSAAKRSGVVVSFKGCAVPVHADDNAGLVQIHDMRVHKALVAVLTRAAAAALAAKATSLGFALSPSVDAA